MNKRFSDSHTRTVHAFAGQDGTQKTDNIMDKLAPNKQTLWRDCNKYYRKSENTTITLKKETELEHAELLTYMDNYVSAELLLKDWHPLYVFCIVYYRVHKGQLRQ